MSSSSEQVEADRREAWDNCIKRATWKVGLGMLFGGIGSAIMGGNDLPIRLCTGICAAWAFNSCRRAMTLPPPPPPPPPPPKPEDPCECCDSNFEPLIADEFDDPAPAVEGSRPMTEQEELKCTCGEAHREENLPTCEEPSYDWSELQEVDVGQAVLEDAERCACEDSPTE